MLNYDPANAVSLTNVNTGIRVDREVAGIPDLQAIFEVFGGPVLVTGLYGVVTVALQAAATTILMYMDVTAGAPALDFDLSVASADFTGDAIGTIYMMPATTAGAITVSAGLNICPSYILPIGELMLDSSALRTGTIKWSMFYYPLTEGAYVEAHA